MTSKLTITDERLAELVAFKPLPGTDINSATRDEWMAMAAELQERRQADSEPVAEVLSSRPGNDTSTIDRALPVGTQLYRHAQPVLDNRAITQHFDTIALETAREILCDVNRRHEFLGGEVQLLSRIQCRIDGACRAAMLQAGNSPVIPDAWVPVSERMPDIGAEILYFCQGDGLIDCGIASSSNFSGRGDAELYVHTEGYDLLFGVDVTHWMPLPDGPREVK